MIFVTVGSQKFQFNRLLKAVDNLALDEEIFAQIGYSDYEPKNYKFKKFLNREEFAEIIDKSDIVITHGGTGAIISALKKGKKVIAVPRLKEYKEHVDNHQMQIVNQFNDLNLLFPCMDMDLEKAINLVKHNEYMAYQSNTNSIIKSIEEFIESN